MTGRILPRAPADASPSLPLFLMPAPVAALSVGNITQQAAQPATLAEKHQAIQSNVPAVRPKVVTSTPSISIQPTVDLARYEMETYTPQEVDPHDRDVLCGRGGLTNYHPGNAWYRNMVRANRSLYKASPKHSKILVAKSICGHVLAQGSRFLECDKRSGSWFTISYKRAVDKTSQALREKDRYSEEPEIEVSHIFSQPAGPFSIVTHPPPDSTTRPRFIEDLRKRKAMDEETTETSLQALNDEESAKIGNNISRGKLPSKSSISAATRMAVASGLTGGSPTINRTGMNVPGLNSPLNQDSAAAYSFGQNDIPPGMGGDRVNQLASLFWQNTKRLKTNEMESRGNSLDVSSIYSNHLHTQSKLPQHDVATPTVATSSTPMPAKSECSDPSLAAADKSSAVTTALVNEFLQTSQENKGVLAITKPDETTENDQFADSQEDQFADPEDEDQHNSSEKIPADITIPTVSNAVEDAVQKIEEKTFELKEEQNNTLQESSKGLVVVDQEAEATATAAMDILAFAATTKDETTTTPPPSTMDSHPSSDSTENTSNIGDSIGIGNDLKTPPFCRICKTNLSSPQQLAGVLTRAAIHPELSWIDNGGGVILPETRLLADIVHNHCRHHHPHWPLWNVLTPMGMDTPTPMNVFHRALAASATALPHKMGDTYESVHELCYRVGHRLGLAKGWIWWSPWQDCGKKSSGNFHALCAASKPAATTLLVDYERRLIGAVCESWSTIQTLSHQERVDIYNNFFVIPYCIESLRLKGNLFPPVHPVGRQLST